MEHRCGVDYPRCPGCQERIAELEAEVERLRAVCDSQNRLIELSNMMQLAGEEAKG